VKHSVAQHQSKKFQPRVKKKRPVSTWQKRIVGLPHGGKELSVTLWQKRTAGDHVAQAQQDRLPVKNSVAKRGPKFVGQSDRSLHKNPGIREEGHCWIQYI
jgi:hypothetical protein